MFKQTLVAAAVSAVAFGATAAELAPVSVVNASVEASKLAGYNSLSQVDLTLEKDVQVGTQIDLTVYGSTFVIDDDEGCEPDVDSTQVAFSTLSDDGKTATFVVTTNLEDATVPFIGLCIDGSDAAETDDDDAEVQLKASASLNGLTFETSDKTDVLEWSQKFGAKVTTKFDATIEVGEERKEFEDGETSDTAIITLTDVASITDVAAEGTDITLMGDFDFLLDEDGELDGAIMIDGEDAELTDDGYATVSLDGFTAGTVAVVITVPGDVIIPEQEFSVDVSVDYSMGDDDASNDLLSGADAGEWELNGSVTHVPFLPFGAAYSQSVTVSNVSSQDAGVTAVWYVDGDVVETMLDVTAEGKAVTDISSALRAAAAENGVSGNVAVDIVVNAPEGDVKVVALYYAKADADRLRTE